MKLIIKKLGISGWLAIFIVRSRLSRYSFSQEFLSIDYRSSSRLFTCIARTKNSRSTTRADLPSLLFPFTMRDFPTRNPLDYVYERYFG